MPIAEDSDSALYRAVIDSLRGIAAAFAEPLSAPPDAGPDGVAVRHPTSTQEHWIMAFTTLDGCQVEVQIDAPALISNTAQDDTQVDSPSAAHAFYAAIIKETGAQLSERQTLVLRTRKDPGLREIFETYRRRLG